MASQDLDVIEERERQRASEEQRKRTRKKIRTIQAPASSFLATLSEQKFITLAELDQMSNVLYPRPVVSLYLSLTPEKLVSEKKEYLTAFHSLKHRNLEAKADLLASLSRETQQGLEADLAQIEHFLQQDFDPQGIRGLAIFKSNNQMKRVITLPVYLRDLLVIDPKPYLAPLVELLNEQYSFLLIHLGRGKAEFQLYQLGYWQDLPPVKEFVSKASSDPGKPGKGRRLVAHQQKEFLKQVADRLEKLFAAQVFGRLILIGEEEITSLLGKMLPDRLSQLVTACWGEDPEETRESLNKKIEAAIDRLQQEREQAILDQLAELADQEKLIRGLAAVIEVQNRSLIRRLVVSENLFQPGFTCYFDRYLALDDQPCAICGRKLLPVRNIVDAVIDNASRQQVPVTIFRALSLALDEYAQIAAITYPINT